MTRNLVLTAAVLAGGLFAVGCGDTNPTKAGADAVKKGTDAAKDVTDKAKDVTDKAKDVGNLAAKLKEAAEGYAKDTGLIEKAVAALTAAKATAKDAADAAKLGKLEGDANTMLTDLKKKIGDLAGLKDVASLEGAKKAIGELIEKLKTLLKEYLPKA